jgi:hypothetical protein
MGKQSPHAATRDARIRELCRTPGELTPAEMSELRSKAAERRRDPDYEGR